MQRLAASHLPRGRRPGSGRPRQAAEQNEEQADRRRARHDALPQRRRQAAT